MKLRDPERNWQTDATRDIADAFDHDIQPFHYRRELRVKRSFRSLPPEDGFSLAVEIALYNIREGCQQAYAGFLERTREARHAAV